VGLRSDYALISANLHAHLVVIVHCCRHWATLSCVNRGKLCICHLEWSEMGGKSVKLEAQRVSRSRRSQFPPRGVQSLTDAVLDWPAEIAY